LRFLLVSAHPERVDFGSGKASAFSQPPAYGFYSVDCKKAKTPP
jgi:hypothetical protein